MHLHGVAHVDAAGIAAAGGALLASLLCSAAAWRAGLAAAGGTIALRTTVVRFGIGSLTNALVPARAGDALRFALIARAVQARRPLAVAGTAAISLAGARAAVRLPVALAAGAHGGLLAVAAGGCCVVSVAAALRAGRNVGRCCHVLGWTVAATVARLAATTAVAAAAGLPHPLACGLVVLAALDLAGWVPVTPGNVGVTSAAVTAALAAAGASPARALTAAIAFDALQTGCGLAFGGTCAAAYARGRRRLGLGLPVVRGVREFAELARHEVRRLLADVHRVVADPLDAARDDDHPQAPFVPALVAGEAQHVADDAPVRAVDQLVEVDEPLGALGIAFEKRVDRRADHLLGPGAHLLEGVQERLVGREPLRQLRQLGDRDAIVGHPLEVQVDVQHREHVPEVDGDRCLPGEQRVDALLDPEEAAVDLVVEGDHLIRELDILPLERGNRAAERAEDEVAFLA
jgi:uncharacterized membrane protein YbhN (UPF0104 family)